MSQKDSNFVLEAFQLDYLKFQNTIFQILKILQVNSKLKIKSFCLRIQHMPGIMVIFLTSIVLNGFYETHGENVMIIAGSSLLLVGIFQVLCKIIVINLFPEEIKELINWIGEIHVNPAWTYLRIFIKERCQVTLRYLKIVTK